MMPLVKKAPTLVVIGVTGFVAYTVLFPEGDQGPPGGGDKPPSATRAPAPVASNTPRNPFQREKPASAESTALVAETSKPSEPAEPGSKKGSDELPALPAEDDRVLESMKLVGTFVDSREQLAIIDNKVYARGDQLRGSDGATLPYIVTEIRKDRALVRRGRRDFVMAFSDVPRPAGPKPASPPKPGEDKPAVKTETVARFTPIEKGKKGQSAAIGNGNGKPGGSDPNDQRELLLQLLSSIGGGGQGGSNPLGALGSGSGANASALSALVNPTTLGAGLDAIMGKGDNIGQGSGSGP